LGGLPQDDFKLVLQIHELNGNIKDIWQINEFECCPFRGIFRLEEVAQLKWASPYKPDFSVKLDDVKIDIRAEKLLTEEIAQLLRAHWLFCTSTTPAEHVYALDESKLFAPDITVFGARVNGKLLGVGALRKLDSDHAELKSMHTLAKSRGQGIGKAIVRHIEEFAKGEGMKRISLETGATEPFRPARQLYTSLGYQDCDAFGEYVLSEHNACMTKLI
jgi:putative acetyltransferase